MRILVVCLAAALAGCFRSAPEPAEGFTVAEGLEWTLWASEPDVVNPTNMAIDERGRIWITEAINYRRHLKNEPDLVDEGDRILILEDSDGDGRADRRKVFDQNSEIRSPLGIAVLGDKVYISQSPDIIVYTKDEDDAILKKETLLTGFGGYDHDHGVHAIVYGFDGRLYFNAGDRGFDVTDNSGVRLISSAKGPYYAGCVLRMDADGTGLELFAHNFRNPYELAVDSFGTVWQTDNDDDGNKWTRLNYVMEGGNFGYWGPGGRKWREDHGTHFHHELPGVVPDIARTGPGSPTGLVVYEADLLPETYRGRLLHSEPGKRRIYAFSLEPDGAGYRMTPEELVSSPDANWRPSDVAIAPDGAVFVADWYDPVVGGRNMLDHEKGRIYRLAPPDHLPQAMKTDLSTLPGLIDGLRSPNQAVRYLADRELTQRGADALPALAQAWDGDDRILRARALWLLARIGGKSRKEIDEALASDDADFRILGIRAARLIHRPILAAIQPLLRDPDPRVRREAALALQHLQGEQAVEALVELASGYDGRDRWYLEAWAIGARGKEQQLAQRLEQEFGSRFDPRLADFYWQLKPQGVLPYLTEAVGDASLPVGARLRALRAIGDRNQRDAARALAAAVESDRPEVAAAAFDKLSRQLFSQWIDFRGDAAVVAAVRHALGEPALRDAALTLAADLGDKAYARQLRELARQSSAPPAARAKALEALVRANAAPPELLDRYAAEGPTALRVAAVRGLAAASTPGASQKVEKLALADGPPEVRSTALRSIGRDDAGLRRILDLQESGELPAQLKTLATTLVHRSKNEEILARARTVLPAPTDAAANEIPVSQPWKIAGQIGDPERGREVFYDTSGPKCSNCHSLEEGKELAGPNLTAIGAKYDKMGLLDSILNPSAGIAPEYYVYILDTKTEGMVIGVLAEDTPQRVAVRNEFGDEIRLDPGDIVERRKSNLSMMPEDLVNTMTERELVDLLEFLSTLQPEGERIAGG